MLKYKDQITNICGFGIALAGAPILCKQAGVSLPDAISHALILAGVFSGIVVAYFTGKPNVPPSTPAA